MLHNPKHALYPFRIVNAANSAPWTPAVEDVDRAVRPSIKRGDIPTLMTPEGGSVVG